MTAWTTAVTMGRMEREHYASGGWLPGIIPDCSMMVLGASGVLVDVIAHRFHWL